jgi:transposase
MAYGIDYRKRMLEYKAEGHTYKEVYETFKIYPSTLIKWRNQLELTGDLSPQYRETRVSKIDMKELEQALARKPDATLAELAAPFNCTEEEAVSIEEREKSKRASQLAPSVL